MTETKKYRDLVCPIGKYPLVFSGENLICTNCGAGFSLFAGIPNLIIDEAQLPEGVGSFEELKCFKETIAAK